MRAAIACGLMLLSLAGCASSPEIRYYTLSAAAPIDAAGATATRPRRVAYLVNALRVPDMLDRPQIVIRSGANEVEILDYDRWAAPFPDMLRRALAADLAARLGPGAVVDQSLAAEFPLLGSITIGILDFDPRRQGPSTIEVSWSIRTGRGTQPPSEIHRARRSLAAAGPAVADLVAAMDRLVAQIADDIAATIPDA